MSRDNLYQQLRGHLAYLKLTAAAEALPGELVRDELESLLAHHVGERGVVEGEGIAG